MEKLVLQTLEALWNKKKKSRENNINTINTQRGHKVPLCYIQCKSLSQSSRYATMMPNFSSVCRQAVSFLSLPPDPSVIFRMQHGTSSLRPQSCFLKSFFNLKTNEDPCNKIRARIRRRETAGCWGGKLKVKTRFKQTTHGLRAVL